MFGSKKSSTPNVEDHKEDKKVEDSSISSLSRTTTLRTDNDIASEYTLKPTLSSSTQEKGKGKEKVGFKGRMKEAYLKLEAKTPHGKDRIIMEERKKNGVRTEKLGEKIYPKVMINQSAAWGMGGLDSL